jgi:hypothetical protein
MLIRRRVISEWMTHQFGSFKTGNEPIMIRRINARVIISSSLSDLVSFVETPRLKLFPSPLG